MIPGHLIVILGAAGVAPASLVVSTGADVVAPCPAASTLVSTLQRRLPALRVATDASLAEGDLGVSLSADGPVWRLRVAGFDGASLLVRELRPVQASCAVVAETALLVLDRFLTTLAWRGEAPRLQADSLTAPAVRGRGGGKVFTLGAGLALWTEVPWDADPALALELSMRAGRAILGFWAAGPSSERMVVRVGSEERGTLRTSRGLFGSSFGGCSRPGPAAFCAGVLAGAAIVAGRAEGELFANRPAQAFVGTLGGFGRVVWPLPWGFETQLDASALRPLGRAQVGVDGTAAVRRTPRLYGLYSLRLAWRTQ